MGKAASKAIRPMKNFNVENRAQKVLQSDKPRAAPRHPSTVAAFDSVAQEHPEFLQEQKTKDNKLDDFLKKVKVDSFGDNPEIRPKSERALPEDRRKITPAEYGFPDPEKIPEGRASLRQALEFISQHRLDPRENTAKKIATDYKLETEQVKNVLQYFQTLHMHIPKEMLKKNPKLLSTLDSSPAERQTLAGMGNVAQLGQGDGAALNEAPAPRKAK